MTGVSMLNRWLKYAEAKVKSVVTSSDDKVAKREARLEAEMAEKPWLRSDGESPSFDDVKARIETEAPTAPKTTTAPGKPSGEAAFDLAEQQRAADERLAEIRRSLDIDDDTP